MNTASMHIEKAEDMASKLGEALYHMHSAVKELEDAADDICSDLIAALKDLIFTAEEEKQHFDDVLADAEAEEEEYMNREYERSVI